MELVGNRPLEQGRGMSVEGFQSAGGHAGVDLPAHEQVQVQNEFHLRVLGGIGRVLLDHAGTGVDLIATREDV